MALNSPNPAAIVIKGLMDEANQDGKQYARQDGEWSEVAPAAGKNILINGNFTVNQYGTDLDAQYALTSADNYYVDRWVKRASSRITQMVEDVNYEPSTEYTLSCYRQDGSRVSVTANSPVSGHWDITTTHNLPLYFTDRKIQMEKGDTATEFELEDIGTTLAKCQRYFYRIVGRASGYKHNGYLLANFSVPQFRDIPVITVIDFGGYESSNNGARANYTPSNLSQGIYDHGGRGITLRLQGGTWSSFVPTDGSGIWGSGIYFADAEL